MKQEEDCICERVCSPAGEQQRFSRPWKLTSPRPDHTTPCTNHSNIGYFLCFQCSWAAALCSLNQGQFGAFAPSVWNVGSCRPLDHGFKRQLTHPAFAGRTAQQQRASGPNRGKSGWWAKLTPKWRSGRQLASLSLPP